MELQTIKDILAANQLWEGGNTTYKFISDSLHVNGVGVDRYEIEEEEGYFYIVFKNHKILIISIDEHQLTIFVDKQNLTLYRQLDY